MTHATETRSPVTKREKWLARIEDALYQAPPEVVCALFHLTREELRDLFPEWLDDGPEPDRNPVSGY
jgi:hypothetical protein